MFNLKNSAAGSQTGARLNQVSPTSLLSLSSSWRFGLLPGIDQPLAQSQTSWCSLRSKKRTRRLRSQRSPTSHRVMAEQPPGCPQTKCRLRHRYLSNINRVLTVRKQRVLVHEQQCPLSALGGFNVLPKSNSFHVVGVGLGGQQHSVVAMTEVASTHSSRAIRLD